MEQTIEQEEGTGLGASSTSDVSISRVMGKKE